MIGIPSTIPKGQPTEEQLEQAQRLNAAILERISDGFFALDREMVVTYFNDAAEKALGRKRGEVVGRKLLDAFPEARGSLFEEHYTRSFREQTRVSFETYFGVAPYENWYDVRVYPSPEGISVYFQVISERKRIESALRESEERFHQLFDHLAEGVAIYKGVDEGRDFVIVDINKTGQTLSQLRLEEAVGRRVTEVFPAVAGIGLLEVFQRVWRTGQAEHHPLSLYADGRITQWVENYVYQIPSGMVVAIYADKTEKKRAEEALREREEQFVRVFHHSASGVALVWPDGRFCQVNDALCQMLGYTEAELLRKTFQDVTHPDDRPASAEWVRRALAGEIEKLQLEKRYERRDGTVVWGLVHATLIRGTQDEPLHFIAQIVDITERKRSEEALRQSEDLLREAQAIAGLGGYVLDVPTGRWRSSALLDKIFGIDERYERSVAGWVNLIHPEDRAMMAAYLEKEVLGQRRTFDREYRIIRCADQAERWVYGSGKLDLDDQGRPLRMYGTLMDITDRKRVEAEKLSLERQVQHAQKLESLGVLAGGIAHDFNNLLMAILGNADLALDELSPMSPARESIKDIEKAAKRAAELAKQMLAYSGKGRFIIEPINAGQLVQEMAHLLEVSISKKVVLKYNFAKNLPTFDGDATQIRQVIMNLITNASEAIGEKSGVIALSTGVMRCDRAYLHGANEVLRASLKEPLPEGYYTYFEVADTGCGMDAATIEKIFDPFFTTKFTGRGLGMSAVLGIVRGHKGAIKIYSEVGKGTSFKVLFPANDLSEVALGAAEEPEKAADQNWRGTGTILIADDEESVSSVGRQMLERMGFKVLTASDGREALASFHQYADEIVCVLLDLTMPHMDGEEAFREMRRLRAEVAVILCSGYNEQDAIQRFAGKKLAGFIQKPYTMSVLRRKLQEVLAARAPAGAPQKSRLGRPPGRA